MNNKDYLKALGIDNRMEEVVDLMRKFKEQKLFGGFEVKYEAGKVTFVKDWVQRKF